MKQQNNIIRKFDWVCVTIYLLLVIFGWMNLYAANFNPEHPVFFDTGKEYFKQLTWIGMSFGLIWLVSLTDSKFFVEFAYIFYGITILLLLVVLVFGKEVNGAKAWVEIGALRLQPAEFTKVAVGLSLARAMSRFGFSFGRFSHLMKIGGILILPILLIFMQNDTGSALVYFVFVLMFYREGLNPIVLVIGLMAAVVAILALFLDNSTVFIIIGFGLLGYILVHRGIRLVYASLIVAAVIMLTGYGLNRFGGMGIPLFFLVTFTFVVLSAFYIYRRIAKKEKYLSVGVLMLWLALAFAYSSSYFYKNILSPYQLTRIEVTFGLKEDLLGAGYNVNQSMIAIGSGGFAGKGFLQGTQTKFNFVPEQSTDFIFCTVGEEWGFVGTSLVVILFVLLLLRLIYLAERQHSVFSRIYGYCVACLVFFHLAVNIGMTIGLAPVIGIPLPLFSYGGSSLWGFTILLFIFLKLDTNRTELIR